MSKLWFVKVVREIDEPFEKHVRQDTEPTTEQVKEWFTDVCNDNWDYVGRVTVEEVQA